MVSFIRSFAKETCTFKEPTNRSHPILALQVQLSVLSLLSGIWSLVYGSFAKETYHFKEPTNFQRQQNEDDCEKICFY